MDSSLVSGRSRAYRKREGGLAAIPERTGTSFLRDVFADVLREDLVDQCLVADVSAARLLAE
jgi:hypothetical protein